MLSFQTLTTIESLLMSKSHPLWGEFMPLAQVIAEVQAEKSAVAAATRVVPAAMPPAPPGPSEPATPAGYKEVG